MSKAVHVPSPSLLSVHASGRPRRRASRAGGVLARSAAVCSRSWVMTSRILDARDQVDEPRDIRDRIRQSERNPDRADRFAGATRELRDGEAIAEFIEAGQL